MARSSRTEEKGASLFIMNTPVLQKAGCAAFLRGLSIRLGISASDRHVARHALWAGTIMAVQILGGLVQVSLSARTLGPEGFGILAVIIAVTSLIHGVLSAPGGNAVTAFVTREVTKGRPDKASRILRFTLAVSCGLSLIAYAVIAALALTASGLLGIDKSYVGATLLYGVVGILMATHTETLAVLRLADRVSLGLGVTAASTVARVTLITTAWLTDGGLRDIILAHVAAAAVDGVGLFIAAAATTRQLGITDFIRSLSIKVPSDVIRFQTGILGSMTTRALVNNMDSLIVAQLAGASDVGLYRAAGRLADTARRPFKLLIAGIHPEYSRQWYSRERSALRRMALRFSFLSLTFAAAEFGLLAIFCEPVILLLFGDEFPGAVRPLLIMLPGVFAVASISVLAALPAAMGHIRPSLIAGMTGCLAFLVAILWLVPMYGVEGAAWAKTIHNLFVVVVLIAFLIPILRQSFRI